MWNLSFFPFNFDLQLPRITPFLGYFITCTQVPIILFFNFE